MDPPVVASGKADGGQAEQLLSPPVKARKKNNLDV